MFGHFAYVANVDVSKINHIGFIRYVYPKNLTTVYYCTTYVIRFMNILKYTVLNREVLSFPDPFHIPLFFLI